ncbi:MAG TPA: hypothetical protein PL143_08325 [Rhodocyclaceae bacterium]|nr:hypothetical protein [Rhodocyclaceae bacterium]
MSIKSTLTAALVAVSSILLIGQAAASGTAESTGRQAAQASSDSTPQVRKRMHNHTDEKLHRMRTNGVGTTAADAPTPERPAPRHAPRRKWKIK